MARRGPPSSRARVRHALIVNNYSPLNLGDAAIVEGLVASLRAAGYHRICLATMYPDHDWSELGVDAVVPSLFRVTSKSRATQIAQLLASSVRATAGLLRLYRSPSLSAYTTADLVISVGGGYLGAGRVLTNLLAGLNIRFGLWVARRTLVAPMSVRPCSRVVGWILRRTLAGIPVFARDTLSQRLFERCGIHAALASDLALRAPSLARAPRPPPARVIGWAPRDFARDHSSAWSDAQAVEELRSLAPEGYRVALLTQCTAPSADDRPAVSRIKALLPDATVLPVAATLREARNQYSRLDILIGSRMHAAIGAMLVGTPALAVAYEEKVTGIFKDLGLSNLVLHDAESLAERIIGAPKESPTLDGDWSALDAALRGG